MASNGRTGSIPVRGTSIPLGSNSERDFSVEPIIPKGIIKEKRKQVVLLPSLSAVGETRTRTGLLPLPPQSSVSTISPPPLLNWDCKGTTFFETSKLLIENF